MRVPLSDGAEAVFTDHDNGKTSGRRLCCCTARPSNSTTGVILADWQEGESSPLISAATVRLPITGHATIRSAFLVSPKT